MSVSSCTPGVPDGPVEAYRPEGPTLEELALKSDLADAEWERKEAEARATAAESECARLRGQVADLKRDVRQLRAELESVREPQYVLERGLSR